MADKVNPIPEGFHTVTPYLKLQDAVRAIEWYKQVFGATVMLYVIEPDGKIMHAEIKIGSSPVMLTDDPEPPTVQSQPSPYGPPIALFLYVEDVDALAARAVAAGAKMVQALIDADDGDRRGGFEDPFGVTWWIASRIKDISRPELQKYYDNLAKQQSGAQ